MILTVDQLNSKLAQFITDSGSDHVLVVTSIAARVHCLNHLYNLETFEIVEVPNGDSCKTIEVAQMLWSQFQQSKLTRKSTVVAVGGGSVLDLTGFCASTYMRGVNVVYIPTTLLSQVDSAEGGKTGINFGHVKNLIGTFNQPTLILNCTKFLETLPSQEILSGWAEIVKHGILEGQSIWNSIQNGLLPIDHPDWNSLIEQNIRFKKSVVESDFKELGKRKLLNLGHTIGHALEALNMDNADYNHGICVANGIVMETQISAVMNLTNESFLNQISNLIWSDFPKIPVDQNQIPQLLELIQADKKNTHQNLNFTLPVSVGHVNFDVPVSTNIISEVMKQWN
jgi:3-dehydroquinate synthase